MQSKPFKLIPCIFCTIGYNCYIAVNNITAKGYQYLMKRQLKKKDIEAVEHSKK